MMSESIATIKAADSAPQVKPKRPKPKSMLMLAEQSAALFENARLAKERGEKVGWSASISRRKLPKPWDLTCFILKTMPQVSQPDIRQIPFAGM